MNRQPSDRETHIVLWRCPDCSKPSRFGPHYCGQHGKHAEPVEYVPKLTDDELELAASALEFASTYAPEPNLEADALAKRLHAQAEGARAA